MKVNRIYSDGLMNISIEAEMPRDDTNSKYFLNFPDQVGACALKGVVRSVSAERAWGSRIKKDSNLVDSASSHTLVSKIKPCMSKYKSFTLKLRTAHYISYSFFDSPLLLG